MKQTEESAQETTVVILCPPRAVAMSIALAKDLFWAATLIAPAGPHRVLIASTDGEPICCGGNTYIDADCGIDDLQDTVDLVWVAGVWGWPGPQTAAIESWLARAHDAGSLIGAAGTATTLVASAGILDGRLATTYPQAAAAFVEHFPAVNLEPTRALTAAGGVFCAQGINSGADLAVSLIERLHGPRVAASVADDYLVDFHRSYRVTQVEFDAARYHGHADILDVQLWLETHYDHPVQLSRLAAHFSMSPRTLTRRFHSATGELPTEYLTRLRMSVADDLLRNHRLTVSEVARRVGYTNTGAFSDAYLRAWGRRPSAIRTSAKGGNRAGDR
ncbi:GlxA family transcriptional regulator [Rhodococcus sp. TAF43]|uniref:GlxA family transcriptional regulator n=1 Tax=Rhodococcus sp. TAF43 TaxID=3237483 RepID=UPI003F98BC23